MMPATDELIDGPLLTLPPEAGDVNAPRFEPNDDWLRSASPQQQMTAMWRWFATRFEDRQIAVPHDDQGNYLFVEGDPCRVDHVLHQRFDGCVAHAVVQGLVQRVQEKAGNEWVERRQEESGAGD